MARRYCYNNVLPFTAMVAIECSGVVQNILFKAASAKGMSYQIFITYSYGLAALSLLPSTLFLMRRTGLPKFKFPLISRLCLLGIVGFSSQICAYKGLELGSPTLSSAISNLTPAFTFILAVFFRMEKVAWRNSSTRAKIMGTVASVSGASIIVLYKGPQVISSSHLTSSSSVLLQQPLGSSQSNWVLGGVLVTLGYLFTSFWFIIQSQIMKIYPEEMIVTFIYNLSATILSIPGLFGLSFSSGISVWGVRLKGPVYVATFMPLSMVIAAIMSPIFLGDALYIGSVIGALILSTGVYVVLWGKAKEEELTCYDPGSGLISKVPLLQSHKDEEM